MASSTTESTRGLTFCTQSICNDNALIKRHQVFGNIALRQQSFRYIVHGLYFISLFFFAATAVFSFSDEFYFFKPAHIRKVFFLAVN